MTWIWLILASLLSCAGQLCQKQATRPAKAGRRGVHIALWLGLALLALGSGMLVWRRYSGVKTSPRITGWGWG